MREASALRVSFLILGLTGCFQMGPSNPGAGQLKPGPAAPLVDHRLPVYGLSPGRLLPRQPVKEARPETQAAKDLLTYYGDQKQEPAWRAAVRHLSSTELAQRSEAAGYLRDLLDQALKDELIGADPLQPSPFWGVGA